MSNDALWRGLRRFVPDPSRWSRDDANIAEIILSPDGLQPSIVNWQELVEHTLVRFRLEAAVEGPDGRIAQLLDRLHGLDGVRELSRHASDEARAFTHFHVAKDGLEARFDILFMSVGTPVDPFFPLEVRVACCVPSDARTRALMEALRDEDVSR